MDAKKLSSRKRKLQNSLRYGLGGLLTVLSLGVIIGWLSHNLTLIQVLPHFTPMQFNTALCFFLSAISLLTSQQTRIKLSGILAILVFVISGLTLIQYVFQINIGIDELFIKSYVKVQSAFPGRMAPNTAICFLFSSITLFFNCRYKTEKWPTYAAFILNTIVGFLGFISIVGYLTHISAIYSWGNFTGMAVHTAVGFLMLSIGGFPIILQNFANHQSEDNYFLTLLVGAISFIVFFISWQILVGYQDNLIKKNATKDLIYAQAEIVHLFKNEVQAINRLFSRGEYANHYKSKNWSEDINHYFNDFPALELIVAESNKIHPHFFKRHGPLKKEEEKNYLLCRRLFKNNKSKSTNGIDISITQDLFCIEKKSTGMMAILKTNLMLERIFSNSILLPYGIMLEKNKHIIFDKELFTPDFFKYKWGFYKTFYINGEEWKLIFWLNEKGVSKKTSFFPFVFLCIGFLISILLSVMVRLWQLSRLKNKRLIESQKRFSFVIENSPQAVLIVDKHGLIAVSNKNSEKLFGYAKNELLGLKVESLMPASYRHNHVGLRESYMKNPVMRKMAGAKKLYILTKSGKEVSVEIALAPIAINEDSFILCTISDISKREEAEKKLRESEEEYRTLFNSIDEGFFIAEIIFDVNEKPIDWRYLQVNPAFKKQTGLTDVLGKTVKEVVPGIEQHWLDIFGKVLLTQNPIRFENFSADLRRWYDVYAFCFEKKSTDKYVGVLFYDITEKKKRAEYILKYSRNIELIYETTLIAANSNKIEEAMQSCLEMICKKINWPIGHVFNVKENNPFLESSSIWYLENPERSNDFKKITEHVHFKKDEGKPPQIPPTRTLQPLLTSLCF